MDEFALIRRYFAGLTTHDDGVRLGIGDDAALLALPPGEELVVTTDALVAGRHYPLDTRPYDLGWKSLAVNLSDLAAMGARPRWFTLSLTLDCAQPDWLAEFSAGLRALADQEGCALVGGDTTRGPQQVGITALGSVPAGRALRRSGARAGDVIAVTGALGDAALGLRLHQAGGAPPELRARLDRPVPRVAAGMALRDLAHAAIDLSDGLAGDLSHVLAASGVGAVVDCARLPASAEFTAHAPPQAEARHALQLQGGDDYELCVCLAPADWDEARRRLGGALHDIGCITVEAGLRFVDASGANIAIPPHGYRHFE